MVRTPADDVHPVLPGCEPWSSPGGGPHGVLVLHGFTGSPVSMRPLAEVFADAGFAVELPRLPGHGTAVEDMIETGWDDWLTEAERALAALQARVPDGKVVVAGLSMGGALTAALAEGHPELAGIVLINAPVGRARRDGRCRRGDDGGRHGGHGLHRRRHRRSRRRRGLLRRDAAAPADHDDHGGQGRAGPPPRHHPADAHHHEPPGPRREPRGLRRARRRTSPARSSGSGSRRASTSPPSTTTRPRSRRPPSPSPSGSPPAEPQHDGPLAPSARTSVSRAGGTRG